MHFYKNDPMYYKNHIENIYKLLIQKSRNLKFFGDLKVLSRYLKISIDQVMLSLKILEKQKKIQLMVFSSFDFITILDINQMNLKNFSTYALNQLNSPSYA